MGYKIGERIRALRKRAGYTQKELGLSAGLATGSIQQYELGTRSPTAVSLWKIARALKVQISDFFGPDTQQGDGSRYFNEEGSETVCRGCIVCGSPYVHQHHVFYGNANRRISDKYGYVVPLCYKHHNGDEGVHSHPNEGMDLQLKQAFQARYEEEQGTREQFIKEFGRSWL